MFNLLNLFKKKQKQDGFVIFDIPVFKITTLTQQSIMCIDYYCSFDDFVIHFEFHYYEDMSNQLAISKIFYKNVLIQKERNNFKTMGFNSFSSQMHSYFYNTIKVLKKMNIPNLNTIYQIFKDPIFYNVSALEVQSAITYPFGSVYWVSFLKEKDKSKIYTLLKNEKYSHSQIISYKNVCFTDAKHCVDDDTSMYYYNVENVSRKIKAALSMNKYSLQKIYDEQNSDVFFNANHLTYLFYTVITSKEKSIFSHLFPERSHSASKNNISIHLFWDVDFNQKLTTFNVLIYEEEKFKTHTLIKEFSIPIDSKFNEFLLDEDYYIDFFQATLKKMMICYYPSPAVVELLEIDDFCGTLTDDQYFLFEMLSI